MENVLYSLGLDVDKSTFKACLKSKEGNDKSKIKGSRTFSNSQTGFKEADQWIKKHIKSADGTLKITLEATGVYHEALAWYFHEHNYKVHIVLALRAKRYLQSMGIRSKNDQIDAKGLADMGLQQELEQWIPCSENLMKLRSLTRQLEMLQETKTAFNNQLEAATHQVHCDKMVIQNLKSLLKKIEKDIDKVRNRIEQSVNEDPVLFSKYKLVEPIKGIGMTTFATIIAETGGFELFKNQKQLVSYAGYDVVENQSGKRVGKTRISKKGNAHIRRIMFMAAFNVVKYKVDPFCNVYERIYDRTKFKMKAYVAIQRKLLCLIYALWKKDSVYDPAYSLKNTSGDQEPKLLFSVGPQGPYKKVAAGKPAATLDELPYDSITKSPLFGEIKL